MRFTLSLGSLALVLASTACAGGSLGNFVPIPDPDRAVQQALQTNPSPATSQVVFDWDVREPDLQLDGQGVARLQYPDRARLDLWMDNNEPVLAAGLVGDDLWAREERALEFVPSPALLWAFLGHIRPGDGVTLISADASEDDSIRLLRYRLPDGDELWYELRSGRMSKVEVRHEGNVAHDIELQWDADAEWPTEATYRNVPAFSRLSVTVETVERVSSHSSDIWYPAR